MTHTQKQLANTHATIKQNKERIKAIEREQIALRALACKLRGDIMNETHTMGYLEEQYTTDRERGAFTQ